MDVFTTSATGHLQIKAPISERILLYSLGDARNTSTQRGFYILLLIL